jgi:putative peptidoglycan lipid II flippase
VSLLAVGATTRLQLAQTLYVLPVSLFGMSIAAAELPELAREGHAASEVLRERAIAAARRVSFFVVPSLVAFIVLGQVIVAGIFRGGQFGAADVIAVWLILAAYSLGLLASTSTRIYQSAFFAFRDTKTPARIAGLRVLVSAVCGSLLMIQFEPVTVRSLTIAAGIFANASVAGLPLGPVGLALGSAAGAWLEWALLHRALEKRIGAVGAGGSQLMKMFVAAVVAAAVGYGAAAAAGYRFQPIAAASLHPIPMAALVISVFGVAYFAMARALGLTEAQLVMDSVLRRLRRR